MARLNSRQKRALKVRLALHAMALDANPSMVAAKGIVRSSLNPTVELSSYRAPRGLGLTDGSKSRTHTDEAISGFISGSRKGTIVKGVFKAAKPNKSGSFKQDGFKPLDIERALDKKS